MRHSYRIVHFEPNPFNGERFTLGALVRDALGTRFVASEHLPGPACIGSAAAAVAAFMIAEDLRNSANLRFDAVPQSVGSSVLLSLERAAPEGVASLDEWVLSLLPRKAARASKAADPPLARVADALEALVAELRAQRANGRAPLTKRKRSTKDPVEVARRAREIADRPVPQIDDVSRRRLSR